MWDLSSSTRYCTCVLCIARWNLHHWTKQLHFHFSLSCIGEGNGNPLQCSCLENPRDGEAWWASVYGVTQSRTWLKWLSSSNKGEYKRRNRNSWIYGAVIDQWEGPALPQTWMFKVKPVHLNPLEVMAVSWTHVQGRLGKEVTWRWVDRGINSSPTWIQLTLGYGESLRCRGVGNVVFCIKMRRRVHLELSSRFREKRKREGEISLKKATREGDRAVSGSGKILYLCGSLWQHFLNLNVPFSSLGICLNCWFWFHGYGDSVGWDSAFIATSSEVTQMLPVQRPQLGSVVHFYSSYHIILVFLWLKNGPFVFQTLSFLRPVFSLKLNPEAKPQYKVGTLQSCKWLRLKIRSFKFACMTCQNAYVVLCVQNFMQCTCYWTRLGSACPVHREANLLPLFVVKEDTGFIARLCNTRPCKEHGQREAFVKTAWGRGLQAPARGHSSDWLLTGWYFRS